MRREPVARDAVDHGVLEAIDAETPRHVDHVLRAATTGAIIERGGVDVHHSYIDVRGGGRAIRDFDRTVRPVPAATEKIGRPGERYLGALKRPCWVRASFASR